MQNKMQLLAQINSDKENKPTNSLRKFQTEDLLPIILGSFRFQMLLFKMETSQTFNDITTEGNKTIDNLLALIQK